MGSNRHLACTTFGATAIVAMIVSPAAAVDRTFTSGFVWNNPMSWTPFGVPQDGDRAFIDTDTLATLSNDTAGVDGLFISNGGEVRTSGFRLLVSDFNTADTNIQDAGSTLRVTPRQAGGAAFDTDFLNIQTGGLLEMAGGEVEIDADLSVNIGGTLAGHGLVRVIGAGINSLFNSGTIRAEGGTLTLRSIGAGLFDFGGVGAMIGLSAVQAIDGASTLVIDGDLISGGFNSVLEIGAGNTVRFDRPWETVNGFPVDGEIVFNASGGVGTLTGAALTHNGEMAVNTGAALLDTDVVFSGQSLNTVASAAVLQFGGNTRVDFGATFTGGGELINLDGATLTAGDSADIGVLLENRGSLIIGDSPGEVSVTAVEQTASGVLEIELEGIAANEFDVLNVENAATLAGTLDVNLINNFTPVLGNQFTILQTTTGNVSGTFDTLALPVFNGLTFDVIYNTQSVVLEVIAATLVPGDADGDGDVDLDDFNILAANFGLGPGAPGGFSIGDFDEDGDVDLDDFNLLASNFGIGTEQVGALPEPGMFLCVLLGAACRPARRRG